jgi:hypothetical protein
MIRRTVSSSVDRSGMTCSSPPGRRSCSRYHARISLSPYSAACGVDACRPEEAFLAIIKGGQLAKGAELGERL